jgi:hypothetical protein
LELKHDELYSMTPREYEELSEGWSWRYKFQEEREAKYVTILANASGHLKKKLRIEDVLGRNTMSQKKEIAERRKVLAERRKRKEEE